MIVSLLDNDFYKFSMMNAVFHQAPGTEVEYEFKCRNDVEWSPAVVMRIREEIYNYCELMFTEDELKYLGTFEFFHQDFIDFLRLYKPNQNHIGVHLDDKGDLHVEVKGSWLLTILFEVPILAIVNACYFEHGNWKNEYNLSIAVERLDAKIEIANRNKFNFADFGTRRRISGDWQDFVVNRLVAEAKTFVGTSNVYLAKKYGVKAIGTQAHEWFMAFQGMNVKLKAFQKKA